MNRDNKQREFFKHSSLGLLPNEWDVIPVSKCFDILDNKRKPLNGNERKEMNGDIPYYGANGIVDYINDYIFDDSLILIAEDGGNFEEFQSRPIAYTIKGKSWVNNHAHVLKGKVNFCQDFLFYCLEHKNILIWLNGGTRAKLNKSDLERLPIQIPLLSEQHDIAKVLAVWDRAILKLQEKIFHRQLRNKWLSHQLLTGEKRFTEHINSNDKQKTKVGELPKDWDIIYISDVLTRVRKSLTPEVDKIYQEIGIRSHTKGIFYKKPVSGKSLGNKSVFWIQPDCFIVNIVFAWEHAVAKTTDKEKEMIASHRFPMYKPKADVLDLDYLLYFFKSKRGKHLLGLASPGGAGRNKTLGQTEFLKLQIPVPCIEEQRRIASVISIADKELLILEKKLERFKEQKKGLMQQLLTGKIRVNSKSDNK